MLLGSDASSGVGFEFLPPLLDERDMRDLTAPRTTGFLSLVTYEDRRRGPKPKNQRLNDVIDKDVMEELRRRYPSQREAASALRIHTSSLRKQEKRHGIFWNSKCHTGPQHAIFPGHPQEHFIVDKTCHHCGKTRARKAGRPICRECGLCEHCGHHGSLRHRLCPVCQMRCFDQRDHRVCCQSCVKKRRQPEAVSDDE